MKTIITMLLGCFIFGCSDDAHEMPPFAVDVDGVTIINPTGPSPKLLLLGDSRMHLAPWVKYFSNYITDYSKGGSTLGVVEERLLKIQNYPSDIIIIQIGINDLNGEADFDFIERYRNVMIQLKLNCTRVIVIGIINVPEWFTQYVNPNFRTGILHQYNDQLRIITADLGIEYLDPCFLDVGQYLNANYSLDGVHLNDEGNALFMEALKGML